MPIDIEGWIEVKSTESQRWVGNQSLSKFFLADSVANSIFGIAKIPTLETFAGNRGLPEDISGEVETHLDGYRKFESEECNFSIEELFGFSYLIYYEVIEQSLDSKIDFLSQWRNVFELMKLLYEDGNEPENIRLIVWAHW